MGLRRLVLVKHRLLIALPLFHDPCEDPRILNDSEILTGLCFLVRLHEAQECSSMQCFVKFSGRPMKLRLPMPRSESRLIVVRTPCRLSSSLSLQGTSLPSSNLPTCGATGLKQERTGMSATSTLGCRHACHAFCHPLHESA